MLSPGQHQFRAADAVGGSLLASRADSGIGGSEWTEHLCLESLGRGQWRLVVAGEAIDLVDETIPFDQEPDEDGEWPEEVTHRGRPVIRYDGWWEYTDDRVGLVQHDDNRCWIVSRGDLEEAKRALSEDGWNLDPSWQSILRRLRMALGEA
jgi:hypothetical protein